MSLPWLLTVAGYFALFNIHLFIDFWRCWVFVAVRAFSGCDEQGLLFFEGFSLLWSTGFRARGLSSCGFRSLEHRLSSHGTWAWMLWDMWDLPGPGIKLVSTTLTGRFFNTEPSGRPFIYFYVFIWLAPGLTCSMWTLSCGEGGNKTGSILKAGLHLASDCELYAQYQWKRHTNWKTRPPEGRAPELSIAKRIP